ARQLALHGELLQRRDEVLHARPYGVGVEQPEEAGDGADEPGRCLFLGRGVVHCPTTPTITKGHGISTNTPIPIHRKRCQACFPRVPRSDTRNQTAGARIARIMLPWNMKSATDPESPSMRSFRRSAPMIQPAVHSA